MKTKSKILRSLVRAATVVALLLPTLVTLSSVVKPAAQTRTLTFAERVSYQRAIEEVYWRHRIWPKQRPDPKPSLDQVLSQTQVEKKVEDYMRDSQALQDHWQKPITFEQLQSEMDRMAHHTKQPQVLREIFQALGDNPFVIAECLAKPVLTQRLLANLNNEKRTNLTKVAWLKEPLPSRIPTAERQASVTMAAGSANYTLPAISNPSGICTGDIWTPTSITNVPEARYRHTAVWTGTEMIVWGGDHVFNGVDHYLNTGGRYDPSTDTWVSTSTTNAPSARGWPTAVWTGSEMIIWAGYDGANYPTTGGKYNPVTDSWTVTSVTNVPIGRIRSTAVWTGSEMIVWGGISLGTDRNTGGRYNPNTDSWTATSTTNAPTGRDSHTAVWTGNEMVVWGGTNFGGPLNSGGRYDPVTDGWTATSTTNAPSAREFLSAVWTGSEMIVWGGNGGVGNQYLNSGGRYDPDTDSWTATGTTNVPTGRDYHTAVWTGSEMIVWGGGTSGPDTNTGGRYDPGTDSWTATSTIGAPSGREQQTAVWTGSEMIVWAGNGTLNTGGRYCAQSGATPTPTPTATATGTSTATPTATATSTVTATPTPRIIPTPRSRPTPAPRPLTFIRYRNISLESLMSRV